MKPNAFSNAFSEPLSLLTLGDRHPHEVSRQPLWTGLKQLLRDQVQRHLGSYFGSPEPRISILPAHPPMSAAPQFKVYDPLTQQRHVFPNETELRIWLEQRYNESPK